MSYLWNGKRDIAIRMDDISLVKIVEDTTEANFHVMLTVDGVEVDFAQFPTELQAYRVVEEKLSKL